MASAPPFSECFFRSSSRISCAARDGSISGLASSAARWASARRSAPRSPATPLTISAAESRFAASHPLRFAVWPWFGCCCPRPGPTRRRRRGPRPKQLSPYIAIPPRASIPITGDGANLVRFPGNPEPVFAFVCVARVSDRGVPARMEEVCRYADRPFAFLALYVKARPVAHAAILIAVLGAVGCSVGAQYGVKVLVDTLAGGLYVGTHARDAWLGFLLLATLIAADNLLWRVASWIASYTFVAVTGDLRRDLFRHLTGHAPSYFADRMSGTLTSRITATSNAVYTLENMFVWNVLRHRPRAQPSRRHHRPGNGGAPPEPDLPGKAEAVPCRGHGGPDHRPPSLGYYALAERRRHRGRCRAGVYARPFH